jgi:hypothetical protein
MRLSKSIGLLAIVYAISLNVYGRAQTERHLGMILDVQGQVTLQRGGSGGRAQLADLIFADSGLVVGTNSRVVFSFCPTRERFVLTAGAEVSITRDSVRQLKGPSANRTPAAGCTLPQVALGERDIERFGLAAPRNLLLPIPIFLGGDVSTSRPVFEWSRVTVATSYEIEVTIANEPVWSAQVAGNVDKASLAESDPALPAGTYRWKLTALMAGKPVAQESVNFEIKPNSTFSPSNQSSDTASQLERATALSNAGYYSEAGSIYRRLRANNPGDKRLTRELIWLYFNAGLFEAMNDELGRYNVEK